MSGSIYAVCSGDCLQNVKCGHSQHDSIEAYMRVRALHAAA
jgi:hypothetical protein